MGRERPQSASPNATEHDRMLLDAFAKLVVVAVTASVAPGCWSFAGDGFLKKHTTKAAKRLLCSHLRQQAAICNELL